MNDYDTIVIGSGAGGMTAALCMAQAGDRVLVIEQHYVPGGWCHSFTLDQYRFSPGVHYLGELGEGGRLRSLYEGLGVANDMEFFELNPDGIDHAIIGSDRFSIPKGKDVFAAKLKDRFPKEHAGIDRFFDVVSRIGREVAYLSSHSHWKGFSGLAKLYKATPTIRRYGLSKLEGFVRSCVRDPLLRTVLCIQCGDNGLSPARSPLPLHAVVMEHYFNGGYYPRGGGFAIPRAFLRALKRAGGELRLSTRVAKILVDKRDGRQQVAGVRLADGSVISCKRVISNADPVVTLGKLVGPEHLSWRLRRRVRRTRYSLSAISLFFAVDADVESYGLDSGNLWFSETTDLTKGYHYGYDGLASAPRPPTGFLTTTTLKDPTKKPRNGFHTMEAFTTVPFEPFRRWQDSTVENRPQAYGDLKQHLQGRMIEVVERMVPGLSKSIAFAELGTPLSNLYYCDAIDGNLYGTEKTLGQIGPLGFQTTTEIRNLHLCGASTLGHGVMGATVSGLIAAAIALRRRTADLLTAKGQHLRVYRPDQPETWSASMRKRVSEKKTVEKETLVHG